jgi:hypothetical protein
MMAYKFLAAGAVGPFTKFRWPRPAKGPGEWGAAPPGAGDDRWVHACRVSDLPYWLGAELWAVELDGPLVEAPRQVASPRARLVCRVEGWDRAAADEFALDCVLAARGVAASRMPAAARAELLAARDAAEIQAVSGALQDAVKEPAAYVNTAAAAAAGGAFAVSAFVAEMAARALGGAGAADQERARQARWLADRLQLRS